ncbi:phosphoglucomutase [Trichuris trichiura]|uniref:phosphoglucomutase (alpha-D-glucose-1,6-bisphosphate-dependent) n=1 Tax=Trichuris trichiura TaxID=36087 RepID=A0A077Z5X3_TRITR|nr:phosphoglucomutase [Trichuris trichiura]
MQEHYAENFIQCILDGGLKEKKKGATLVVGGDGRNLNDLVFQKIFRIAAANGVGHIKMGVSGLMTTPAVSLAIREFKADGAIILTASHSPGGQNGDFGIKFNGSNGGPVSISVAENIYQLTKTITRYSTCPELLINYTSVGSQRVDIDNVGTMTVEIFDSIKQYSDRMERIFDFYLLKSLFSGSITGKPFRVLIDGMHGVTGPFVLSLFHDRLGAFSEDMRNCDPLSDFGGFIPDTDLTQSALIVEMERGTHDLGAVFDADGDRSIILGERGFFVTASDSLAVLADSIDTLPYFKTLSDVKGFARSMPTAAAVDRQKLNLTCFEVPSNGSFFADLMDAGLVSLFGDESLGIGCSYIREKDCIWSVLAWLTVVARRKMSVEQIMRRHWGAFGRNVFIRYDFENCDVAACREMMSKLEQTVTNASFAGRSFTAESQTFTVSKADNFTYVSPTNGAGLRIFFTDNSRLIFRLFDVSTTEATVCIYADYYVNDKQRQQLSASVLAKPLIDIAFALSEIKKFVGRVEPTVVT